jgi:hypothetical protein
MALIDPRKRIARLDALRTRLALSLVETLADDRMYCQVVGQCMGLKAAVDELKKEIDEDDDEA